jgi:two-component system sensor histidine kinase KdpD
MNTREQRSNEPGDWRSTTPVKRAGIVRNLRCCGLALAGVFASTWVSFRMDQGFAFSGFVYLIFVVLAAMYGGFWQATLVSVAANACLNYFFVPPIFSFVNSPENWVSLGAFEFTALVISRLSDRAHRRTMESERLYGEMEQLYRTSRRILLLESSGEPGGAIAASIRETFNLQAVQLFDALSTLTYRSGELCQDLEQGTRDACFLKADTFDPATRTWFCVLSIGVRPVGGLALAGTGMSKSAATALASLSAIALERAQVLEKELHAQADRQTERLRASVLDALAHQFKTPLAVARTASSGLLALGGLSGLQAEFVAVIDQQAKNLDDLASRLLKAAGLESAEFKPRQSSLLFSELARAAIGKLEVRADRERVHVSAPGLEYPVFADRELILTSIAQLLDNAVKYSDPGSPIDLVFSVRAEQIVLTVKSKGLVVAHADRERVFERFYRAPETRHLPAGTGLGLSIVRKIVESHNGHVWVEGVTGYGTAVSISLPTVRHAIYSYA